MLLPSQRSRRRWRLLPSSRRVPSVLGRRQRPKPLPQLRERCPPHRQRRTGLPPLRSRYSFRGPSGTASPAAALELFSAGRRRRTGRGLNRDRAQGRKEGRRRRGDVAGGARCVGYHAGPGVARAVRACVRAGRGRPALPGGGGRTGGRRKPPSWSVESP